MTRLSWDCSKPTLQTDGLQMKIPFNNFQQEYTLYRKEIDSAIQRVLKSGWFILGHEVESLEKELAEYIGIKYCVTVANGTEAIALALLSLGIGRGDEVITTNMTAYPTITGIEQAGATAVVVDIDQVTGLIDSNQIEKHITKKTRAILPVHMYGQSANLKAITSIARKHKLKVVEDCAQSFGAEYFGKKVGTFGSVSAFSFYPTKNLGAYGDGGAVMTNSVTAYKKLLALRNYGQRVRYFHDTQGINSRLDEVQAAILRVKLRYVDEHIRLRRAIARDYNDRIVRFPHVPEVAKNLHTYHLYVIKTDQRSALMQYLHAHHIDSIIHYPVPVQKQKAFLKQKTEQFPATTQFTNEIISIPLHQYLQPKEIDYIINTINSFPVHKTK